MQQNVFANDVKLNIINKKLSRLETKNMEIFSKETIDMYKNILTCQM